MSINIEKLNNFTDVFSIIIHEKNKGIFAETTLIIYN